MKEFLIYLVLLAFFYLINFMLGKTASQLSIPHFSTFQSLIILQGDLNVSHLSIPYYQRIYLLSDAATASITQPKPIRLIKQEQEMNGIIYTYQALQLAPLAMKQGFLDIANLHRFMDKTLILPLSKEMCLGRWERRRDGGQFCQIQITSLFLIQLGRFMGKFNVPVADHNIVPDIQELNNQNESNQYSQIDDKVEKISSVFQENQIINMHEIYQSLNEAQNYFNSINQSRKDSEDIIINKDIHNIDESLIINTGDKLIPELPNIQNGFEGGFQSANQDVVKMQQTQQNVIVMPNQKQGEIPMKKEEERDEHIQQNIQNIHIQNNDNKNISDLIFKDLQVPSSASPLEQNTINSQPLQNMPQEISAQETHQQNIQMTGQNTKLNIGTPESQINQQKIPAIKSELQGQKQGSANQQAINQEKNAVQVNSQLKEENNVAAQSQQTAVLIGQTPQITAQVQNQNIVAHQQTIIPSTGLEVPITHSISDTPKETLPEVSKDESSVEIDNMAQQTISNEAGDTTNQQQSQSIQQIQSQQQSNNQNIVQTQSNIQKLQQEQNINLTDIHPLNQHSQQKELQPDISHQKQQSSQQLLVQTNDPPEQIQQPNQQNQYKDNQQNHVQTQQIDDTNQHQQDKQEQNQQLNQQQASSHPSSNQVNQNIDDNHQTVKQQSIQMKNQDNQQKKQDQLVVPQKQETAPAITSSNQAIQTEQTSSITASTDAKTISSFTQHNQHNKNEEAPHFNKPPYKIPTQAHTQIPVDTDKTNIIFSNGMALELDKINELVNQIEQANRIQQQPTQSQSQALDQQTFETTKEVGDINTNTQQKIQQTDHFNDEQNQQVVTTPTVQSSLPPIPQIMEPFEPSNQIVNQDSGQNQQSIAEQTKESLAQPIQNTNTIDQVKDQSKPADDGTQFKREEAKGESMLGGIISGIGNMFN